MVDEKWSYEASATFYDTLLELWALEEYLSILEVEFPSLVENERQRLHKDLKVGDKQELYYTEIAEFQLDEGITSRLITGNALITTWATFESAVRRAALSLGLSGKLLNLVEQLFERLKIQHNFGLIRDLYDLRNALAHANGRLDDIELDVTKDSRLLKRMKIERLANSSSGLKISPDGYLIVSVEFVRSALDSLSLC